jgi:hypothetical protein
MVSRKPDAICFHCGTGLEKSELDYITYMNMTEEERNYFKQMYQKRMRAYHEKLEALLNNSKVES